jgi:hypothetical protein
MKLNELHVRELDAGAMRDGKAVTGRDDRVRGVAIHLPTATGGEHGGVGNDLDGATRDARAGTTASAAIDDEIEHACLLEHRNALALLHARAKGSGDFGARLIAVRVDDAMARVRGFFPELELAVGSKVEPRAGGLQLANASGAFFDEDFDGGSVA